MRPPKILLLEAHSEVYSVYMYIGREVIAISTMGIKKVEWNIQCDRRVYKAHQSLFRISLAVHRYSGLRSKHCLSRSSSCGEIFSGMVY